MNEIVPTQVLAKEVLAALDARRQIAPFSQRVPGFGLEAAYAVTAELRRLRAARGERPVGRKIGFTNRALWAQYNVFAPNWGNMYDSTLHALAAGADRFDLSHLSEPLIEPEIAFKLAKAPESGMDEAALLGCVEWFAHGFEIVHSPFPGWRFSAADVVAAAGLHGALLIGARHRIEDTAPALLRTLPAFEVTLSREEVFYCHRGRHPVQMRFRTGVASYLDELDAQRQLFNAEQALVQARQLRLVNAIDLYRALGGGLVENGTQATVTQ